MAKVKLCEVASECRATWKGSKVDVPIVGLEHLVPGDITLTSWDVNSENTFNKRFSKGQILLGRRRVYLRKAVIAPCEGICSGDITILEASPNKLLPQLLPFIIQNDVFFSFAEQGSAGSLSPRVKWEHLKDYEFELPSLAEQEILADKLWKAYELKKSYERLLSATREMVKSRFIEMFGDPKYNNQNRNTIRFDNVLTFQRGHDLPEKERISSGSVPIYGSNGFVGFHNEPRCEFGIVTGRSGTIGRVFIVNEPFWPLNTSLYSIETHGNNLIYLKYMVELFDVTRFSNGTGVPTLNRNAIHQELIPEVKIEEQQAFATIAEQADKSEFELKKAIEAIDAVIKSLINN